MSYQNDKSEVEPGLEASFSGYVVERRDDMAKEDAESEVYSPDPSTRLNEGAVALVPEADVPLSAGSRSGLRYVGGKRIFKEKNKNASTCKQQKHSWLTVVVNSFAQVSITFCKSTGERVLWKRRQ